MKIVCFCVMVTAGILAAPDIEIISVRVSGLIGLIAAIGFISSQRDSKKKLK